MVLTWSLACTPTVAQHVGGPRAGTSAEAEANGAVTSALGTCSLMGHRQLLGGWYLHAALGWAPG